MMLRRLCIAVFLGCSLTRSAEAQRAASMRLGITVDTAAAPTSVGERPVADTGSSRLVNTMRGALIGSGIGAAGGLILAFVETHNSSVTDHSEDAMGYITFITLGALIGYVVGGVVGFVRN